MVAAKICFSVKDIHREKTRSDVTPTPKEQYEYEHLDWWYIKSTIYKRFLKWNKIFKKTK